MSISTKALFPFQTGVTNFVRKFLLHNSTRLTERKYTSKHPAWYSIYVQHFFHYNCTMLNHRLLPVALREIRKQCTLAMEATIDVARSGEVTGCHSHKGFKCLFSECTSGNSQHSSPFHF